MKPIVIWSPEYRNTHGGIRALHVLKEELILRELQCTLHYEGHIKDPFVIYPEIVMDNRLGAEQFMYWFLNKSPDRSVPVWAWETGMGDYPLLTVDIIEPFWHPRPKRGGVAWWKGKGLIDTNVIPDGAVEISHSNFPDRQDLADFISGLDYLISFDAFTALNVEALVSGTPVLIHQVAGQWSREAVESHGWLKHGVAWNPDELDTARESVAQAPAHYDDMRKQFQSRIDAFAEWMVLHA